MRKFFYVCTACVLILFLTGCSKNENIPVVTAVTPTPIPDTDVLYDDRNAASSQKSETDLIPGRKNNKDDTGPSGTPEAVPSKDPAASDKEAGRDTSSDTGKTSADTDGDSEGTDGHLGDEEQKTVGEYWNNSFLVWLPLFDHGSFNSFYSDETHDYLVFEGINIDMAVDYIRTLNESGFTEDVTCTDGDGEPVEGLPGRSFTYSACNGDGWRVRLIYDYNRDYYTICSGYDPESDTDKYADLMENTPIGLLPEFRYGVLDSSGIDKNMYYAVFSDTEIECSAYTEQLKEAGFVFETDEGDSDGIIWFNGYDEAGNYCDFVYTDGFVRLGIECAGADSDE